MSIPNIYRSQTCFNIRTGRCNDNWLYGLLKKVNVPHGIQKTNTFPGLALELSKNIVNGLSKEGERVMGVYIKGMKIPKDCRECPFEGYHVDIGQTYCMACLKVLATAFKPISFDGRSRWCPLVEVPKPHGRLIEKPDVSEYEVFDEDTGTREISLFGLMECHRMVKEAETIIEAEGE